MGNVSIVEDTMHFRHRTHKSRTKTDQNGFSLHSRLYGPINFMQVSNKRKLPKLLYTYNICEPQQVTEWQKQNKQTNKLKKRNHKTKGELVAHVS